MTSIQERIQAMTWRAGKRTLPRRGRVPEEVLQQVEGLRDSGKFQEAADLLEQQPGDALEQDPVALNGLGHLRLGLHQVDDALEFFRRAEAAAKLHQAKALVNQSHALRDLKRFDEAEQAARHACDLKPDWFLPYLMWIAVCEWRAGDGDAQAVRTIVEQMTQKCSGWHHEPGFWTYIDGDIDYRRLREPEEFERLFGDGFRKFEAEQAK